jgi:hypothetical protein
VFLVLANTKLQHLTKLHTLLLLPSSVPLLKVVRCLLQHCQAAAKWNTYVPSKKENM